MNYEFKPRYYDERKEYLNGLKEKYRSKPEENTQEQIKLRLQSSFQRRFEEQRKGITYSNRAANIRVFIIFVLLGGFAIYFITRFLPILNSILK